MNLSTVVKTRTKYNKTHFGVLMVILQNNLIK